MFALETTPYGAITNLEFFKTLQDRSADENIVLYHVYALGVQSFVESLTLLPGIPTLYPDDPTSEQLPYFFNCKFEDYSHASSRSLLDCNVIPNHYNDHYVFLDKEDAEVYVQYYKSNMSAVKVWEERQTQINRIIDEWDDYDNYEGYDNDE